MEYSLPTSTSDEDKAGILSRWLLLYLTPLLQFGAKKPLEQKDCGVISKTDSAEHVHARIQHAWGKQLEYIAQSSSKTNLTRGQKPILWKAILEAFGPKLFFWGLFYYVLSTVFMFIPVVFLNDLVNYVESGNDGSYKTIVHPWIETMGMGLSPMIVGVLQTRSQAIMVHFSAFVRTAVSDLVLKKALAVSPTAKSMTSLGQTFNLMSNDAVQIQKLTMWVGLGLSCPFLVVIALYMIHRHVGRAMWVGVGVLGVSLPINAILFAINAQLRRKVLVQSDMRINMMNEFLTGIRVIKFNAWEEPYGAIVARCRSKELKYLTLLAGIIAVGFSVSIVSIPIIQPILVFFAYTKWENETMSAAKAFSTITLFAIMRFPFVALPIALIAGIQCSVALSRISKYLQLPERKNYITHEVPPFESEKDEIALKMEECSFGWIDPDTCSDKKRKNKGINFFKRKLEDVDESPLSDDSKYENAKVLKKLTFTIKKGNLVGVVGRVGSGKSSLLNAILGDMESLGNGKKVYIPGGGSGGFLGYCPQTPWVINETIRGNIVFYRDFDENRYQKVLKACALVQDLESLPSGDMTEIGERGINLSGGQKARVSLARALYSGSVKLLLLDDPLSAVDGHVCKHLFKEAVCGSLWQDTTRILVTHHVEFLSDCDCIIVLEDGRIKHFGSYDELVEAGVNFQESINVLKKENVKQPFDEEIISSGIDKFNNIRSEDILDDDIDGDNRIEPVGNIEVRNGLIDVEERELGSVGLKKYWYYASVGGLTSTFGYMVSQVLGRGAEVGQAFWLSYWAHEMTTMDKAGVVMDGDEVSFFLNVYALIGLIGMIFLTLRSVFQSVHRLYASSKLHRDMLLKVLRAPISFYDTTPIGRLLNRFSADLDRVDLTLPMAVLNAGHSGALIVGSIVAIIISTKGLFFVSFVPIFFLYYIIQKWFRLTATELQRLSNIANSPIFKDFSEALSGISSIRAYQAQDIFNSKAQNSFNQYNVPYVLYNHCTNWLSLRLDVLGGVVQAFIAGLALATAPMNLIPAGSLGLALSFSIEATTFLKQGVRSFSKLEAEMSGVERILYYTRDIPEEAPACLPGKDPDANSWPSAGQITFSNVSLRYHKGPKVLNNLNFVIRAGEKIGVVGRTGSGKSSIMNALFRITEIEKDGKIEVDGVNIERIGTDVLRKRLSIIPQDPVLFTNVSVRHNLDPFQSASEVELWQVLKTVKLMDVITALPLGLDEMVTDVGQIFSQGQRQLLFIARSLLRNTTILVLDEATASMDNETDSIIQQILRENFGHATILTISHRVHTIMDSDRILVMDAGRVVEFDTPQKLMKKESLFQSFVSTGKQNNNK